MVIDRTDGTELADSRKGLPLNIANYPVVAAAERSDQVTVGRGDDRRDGVRDGRGARGERLATGLPRHRALVSTPLTDLQRAVRSVQHQILLAGGLALIATLLAGYLASYFIARRLKRIERGALSIAVGRLLAPGARPGRPTRSASSP